ncbi:hypothetical protein [Methylocaldum sp.]|uniref:hypothetical protein n=1 Tax=Methylocaldum sp. TaxID=1969727 RepID=UPI002D550C31|nr:hypothetical protein [Methylocaldum sp.]HYE36715.1 hypothetical protein [Methylocaldum sp.]
MNPLLYKAHPLLYLSVDLLIHPSAHPVDDFSRLILIYLVINLLWMAAFRLAVRRTVGIRLTPLSAYGLALPSALFYAPLMLTVLNDVLAHAFRLEERYILIFVIAVAAQMLAALYAAVIRFDRTGQPIGVRAGIAISLFLLLSSIPFGFLLLGLNAALRII